MLKRKHSKVLHHFWQTLRNAGALSAGYQPKHVEADKWQQLSKPASGRRVGKCRGGTLRLLLPPPNVTGNLHLGHALMATVQDVICRQRRQLGYEVVWVPGTDHAGIATQVVVEKRLLKERSLTRHQLGREAFLREVWRWKADKGGRIVEDLKKLGCTLNWEKEYFTMDERQAYAVNVAFVRLFEEGLIKRQESLVNWSCALESAISDIEVESLDLKGATEIAVPGYAKNVLFGRIYDIGYRVLGDGGDGEEEIIVSTTRPETLLGDVAVAVHPTDERYAKYRNRPEVKLWHPFRKEAIPLIFDISVNPEFGTGAVKITPAHDRSDFALAQRHLLMMPVQVFTEQGRISEEHPEFAGQPRFETRERILERLAEMNLLRSVRDHAMQLPMCSRSKDIIEYMLRPQWFLHCQPLAEAALAEVLSGRLQIVPPNYEIDWQRWLEDCHEWCISRQLWWGHQIPAYRAQNRETGESLWVAALTETEALGKAQRCLGAGDLSLTRDPDVLDTWFSSALLPFSAFGWPDPAYKEHYPLDLMVTGNDILFFWVARMVMLGLKLTGSAPFKKVLLNGIVCDVHGRKMSKSLGNVVTPHQVVQGASLEELQEEVRHYCETGLLSDAEMQKSLKGLKRMFPQGIPECGTDALRLTLCSHNIKHHFINFDVAECHTNKMFLNKIWQATRYTLGAAERLAMPLSEVECMNEVPLGKWDSWILSRLADTLQTCAQSFENYNLHTATASLKQFLYSNLCDVYLETTKRDINAGSHEGYIHCATLATCLSWALQAMSPFTPFIAEELLHHLPRNIVLNLNNFHNANVEQEIGEILEICQNVRQLKSRNKISKRHEPQVRLYAHTSEALALLQPHLNEIQTLTLTNAVHLDMLEEAESTGSQQRSLFSTAGHMCSFEIITNESFEVRSNKAVDTRELNRQKLKKLESELTRYRLRVENEGFRRSASEHVQQKHLEKIRQLEVEIEKMKSMATS